MVEKKPLKQVVGKTVVTKEGKRLGIVKDITFETRTGELINLILIEPTAYVHSLGLEKSKEGIVVPYSSIIAVGDFVVVAEEDIV